MPTNEPYKIFDVSDPANPRFGDRHEDIKSSLEMICESWGEYLSHYLNTTKSLFSGKSEVPWLQNERALVSTLASAISRKYKNAVALEELPVKKPALPNQEGKTTDLGRCDLWAHIPMDAPEHLYPFSFYLEAKKFRKHRKTTEIEATLVGANGISRMFKDFSKSRPERIDQRSPYASDTNRRHPHFVIGLIALPLIHEISDYEQIKNAVEASFCKITHIELPGSVNVIRRKVQRFPTVGMIFTPNLNEDPGLLITLTVLAKSADQ